MIKRSNEYYHSHKNETAQRSKVYRAENKEIIAKRKHHDWVAKQNIKKQVKIEYENSLITVRYPDTHQVCTCCRTLKHIKDNFNTLS